MFWIFTESKVNTRHTHDFHKGQFLEMLRILQNVILVKIPSMNGFHEPCCFRQHFSKTNEASNLFQVPLETCTEFNPYLPIFTLNKVHGLYLSSFLFVNLPIKKNIISAGVTINCWCRRYYLIMHTYTCCNIAGRL